MQVDDILATLHRAAQAPSLAGIYIKSVCIAATYRHSSDAVLTITWSMPDWSAAIEGTALPGTTADILSRPSDTAIALDRQAATVPELEEMLLSLAWQTGAWDFVRTEQPPLADPTDWRASRHGVANNFGINDYVIAGQPMVTGDAAPESARIAASTGYVIWRFVPLAFATPTARSRWGLKDKTLQPGCTRVGVTGSYRAPWHHHATPGYGNEHQYQLGRANHGNRSKSSIERNA